MLVSTRSVADERGRRQYTKEVIAGLFLQEKWVRAMRYRNYPHPSKELPTTIIHDPLLQRVKRPGFGNSLGAALHPQFATEVQDMFLDRVHAKYQLGCDLTVG